MKLKRLKEQKKLELLIKKEKLIERFKLGKNNKVKN